MMMGVKEGEEVETRGGRGVEEEEEKDHDGKDKRQGGK